MQDGDEGVAVESCEFWAAFCDSQLEPEVLRPFLSRILPVLLRNMVYEEHDEEVQVRCWLDDRHSFGLMRVDRTAVLGPCSHAKGAGAMPEEAATPATE